KDPEVEIWAGEREGGFRVVKTTMGVSYFYIPFFVVAHHVAINSVYKANGFSIPYKMAIILGTFFFFIWALIFLRKYLLFFFSEIVVFWTLLIVGIGTNIVTYVTQQSGLSHVYSFFLVSVFIYYTHVWYDEKRLKHLLLIGFLSGWIVLVRPTNALVIFVFIFYGVNSFSALGKRLKMFALRYKEVLLAVIVSFAVVLPQLLYWKYNTGDWIHYSYPDEGFFFGDPKIIDGLFSYRKGWLLYTPLMALSFLGFLINNKKTNAYKPTLFMLLIVFLYVTFSWWSWWYGGSFGMRTMIDIY